MDYQVDIRNNQKKKIAEAIADLIASDSTINKLSIYAHLKMGGEDLASMIASINEDKLWNQCLHLKPDKPDITPEENYAVKFVSAVTGRQVHKKRAQK